MQIKTLVIFVAMSFFNSQDFFSGKPCLDLKGVYSPVNVININIQNLLGLLDPFTRDSSIEIIDLLFDQGTERFKYIFKLSKEGEEPFYLGILTRLQERNKVFKQIVLKSMQTTDFSDIQKILIYTKDVQPSKLKCPLLKKHFQQSLRNYLGLTTISKFNNLPENTNIPIQDSKVPLLASPQDSGLRLNQSPQKVPQTVEEAYSNFDLSVLQNLPDTREFNITYNRLVEELTNAQTDPIKTQNVLQRIFDFVTGYRNNNQFINFNFAQLYINDFERSKIKTIKIKV